LRFAPAVVGRAFRFTALGYTARMSDYDPNQEINPAIPLGLTAVLVLLGFATVYAIVFLF
jgi:hypothetical protein